MGYYERLVRDLKKWMDPNVEKTFLYQTPYALHFSCDFPDGHSDWVYLMRRDNLFTLHLKGCGPICEPLNRNHVDAVFGDLFASWRDVEDRIEILDRVT